jgi:hypothetical protein
MSGRFETPWERWLRDPRQLQLVSPDDLARAFVLFFRRSPSNDGLIGIDGVDYELPLRLKPRGRKKEPVRVHHLLLAGSYHVLVGDRLVQIHPVDLAANARAPRGRGDSPAVDAEQPPVKSAADMAFDRHYGPVTDADGGFVDPTSQETDS